MDEWISTTDKLPALNNYSSKRLLFVGTRKNEASGKISHSICYGYMQKVNGDIRWIDCSEYSQQIVFGAVCWKPLPVIPERYTS